MQPTSEKDFQSDLNKIKHILEEFKDNGQSLSAALETASKHLPVYLKIVKSHIEQLSRVLETDNHHQTRLENIDLPQPILQLMRLFETITENDVDMLSTLAYHAQHWSGETIQENAQETVEI